MWWIYWIGFAVSYPFLVCGERKAGKKHEPFICLLAALLWPIGWLHFIGIRLSK